MTEIIFGKNLFDVFFDSFAPPANIQGVRFVTCTATTHLATIDVFFASVLGSCQDVLLQYIQWTVRVETDYAASIFNVHRKLRQPGRKDPGGDQGNG